jgi:FtsZ-interacting cell division protein ZipA
MDTLSDEGVVSKPRKSSAKPAETSKAEEVSEPVIQEDLSDELPELKPEEQPEEQDSIELSTQQPDEDSSIEPEVENSLEVEDSEETDVSAQSETVEDSLSEPEVELDAEPETALQTEPDQAQVQALDPETSDVEQQTEEKPEPALGHVEDLFGLDLDRPIHELMDASSKSTKKKRTTKSSRAKQVEEESSAAFDELLEPRPELIDEPLDDIDSLVAETAIADLDESVESTVDASDDAGANIADVESSESGSVRKPRKLDMTDPESTLVLFVVAPEGQAMSGQHLKTVVEKCGMEFGQMGLFHRFEDNSDSSPIQFSMSSVSGSGAFDLETIDAQEMRAVTFFMSMREPRDPSYAVECMLATAATLSKALGCEMLDNDRSVMRPQTQEHYRELVKAFKLKERAKSRRTRKTK